MSLLRLSIALAAVNALAIALISSWAHAQTAAPSPEPAPPPAVPFSGPVLATDRVIARAVEPITVTSTAFAAGGLIPDVYTRYGKSVSPPLAWSGAPAEARAFVVMVEDPDSGQPEPTLHWLAFNIPGDRHDLPRNVRNRAEVRNIPGMLQGINSLGGVGWVGPHPPVGDPPHHYHFEVFALAKPVSNISGKANRDRLIIAMNDHVLAEGDLVGLYAAPKPAAPPAAK